MKGLAIILLLALALLQYQLWVGDGSLAELRHREAQVRAQTEENERLRERNDRLQDDVLSLKEDLEVVEERARTDLGMIREDETFYLIIE